MNLNDAKKRIQNYLNSTKKWALLVDVQTKSDLAEIVDFFKIGDNKFPSMEELCSQDGFIKLDELYATVSNNSGNTFISGITGFLMFLGKETIKKTLKNMITTNISGHVVIITYQCKEYLSFSDPRIKESGRLIMVDGKADRVCEICFIAPALSGAFPGVYQGIQKIGYIIENCCYDSAYIATAMDKSFFSQSLYHITQLNNGYDILLGKDLRTSIVPQYFGSAEEWNYVLQHMGKHGNWSSVVAENFGSENNLTQALMGYELFDKQKKWLYFVALCICGVKDNEYLQLAVDKALNSDELMKSIFHTILTVDWKSEKFIDLCRQRKELIRMIKNTLPMTIDFCKVLSVKGENAIFYLTDLTQPEKEKIIAWLDTYGSNYTQEELISILTNVYPDLAKYLSKFRFQNELLDSYFERYKYQKVVNCIFPSFEAVVDEQSVKMEFVTALKPRTSYVDKLDIQNSQTFFFDALGVEYLGFIQQKCNEYNLSANITCARCELPSLTEFNKEFIETLTLKGCPISDIKDLDEIKHHGKNSFDYEKEKAPIYLIRELEVIDNLLKKIQASVFGGEYSKAIIISDHGASRLAVLHGRENVWSMATKGKHSGRCCKISEIDSKPDFAIEESGFWVLANYDRFKGSRRANVEVHGGASIEEVAVPIIEITQKLTNIEAFIVDASKVLTLGAKEHAVIKIYVGINSNNIAIKLNGNYYHAEATGDSYIYSVNLKEYTRKGKFTFDIVNGNDVLAIEQQFEIKKKGMSEVNMFD